MKIAASAGIEEVQLDPVSS